MKQQQESEEKEKKMPHYVDFKRITQYLDKYMKKFTLSGPSNELDVY